MGGQLTATGHSIPNHFTNFSGNSTDLLIEPLQVSHFFYTNYFNRKLTFVFFHNLVGFHCKIQFYNVPHFSCCLRDSTSLVAGNHSASSEMLRGWFDFKKSLKLPLSSIMMEIHAHPFPTGY